MSARAPMIDLRASRDVQLQLSGFEVAHGLRYATAQLLDDEWRTLAFACAYDALDLNMLVSQKPHGCSSVNIRGT